MIWRQYHKPPFQSIKNTPLLWFQYRILHRILAINTGRQTEKEKRKDLSNIW